MGLRTQTVVGIGLCVLAVATPFIGYGLSLGESRAVVTTAILTFTFAPVIVPALLLIGAVLTLPEVVERWKEKRRERRRDA
jgi:multisubunit Na+/H+ antiporter MnhG subunit